MAVAPAAAPAVGAPVAAMNFNVVGNDRFWPHQRRMYQEIQDWVEAHPEGGGVLVEMCTGSGKTFMMAVTPFAFRAHRTLVIVPSTSTKDELKKKLQGRPGHETAYQKTGCIPVGQPHPEVKILDTALTANSRLPDFNSYHIVVANAQLVSNRTAQPSATLTQFQRLSAEHAAANGGRPLFDLIVFEEGHHAPSPTWTLIKNTLGATEWQQQNIRRKPYLMYLTGTPYRLLEVSELATLPTRYTLTESIRDRKAKDLVMLNIHSPAATGNKLSEKMMSAATSVGKVMCHLLKHKRTYNGGAIRHRGLVLVQGIKDGTADTVAQTINALRVPKVLRPHNPPEDHEILRAEVYHAKSSEEIKDEFERPSGTVDILVVDGVLREVYDLPAISVLGIMRKVGTVTLFGQFLGRGVRQLLQDYVGAGVIINNSDNVCHVVSHNLWEQVPMFFEYVEQAVVREELQEPQENPDQADDGAAALNAAGPSTSSDDTPTPTFSPIDDEPIRMRRYIFPIRMVNDLHGVDVERTQTLRNNENELYFNGAQYQVEDVDVPVE